MAYLADIRIDGDWKLLRSPTYNYDFNLRTGTLARWGRTKDEDPVMSPVGPEIADIEIVTGGCSGHCPWCAPPGSSVISLNGRIPIEKLSIGDFVVGWDENRKRPRIQEIIEIYERDYEGPLIEIELELETVRITPNHKILLSGGEWKMAKDILEGDDIQSF